jgi:hypothetical protein
MAEQRHKIIRKGLALLGDESVSVVTVGMCRRKQETYPCVSTSLAMTALTYAASRRPQ